MRFYFQDLLESFAEGLRSVQSILVNTTEYAEPNIGNLYVTVR